jgi:glycosyltransferase involved in cell wall biosynthesis
MNVLLAPAHYLLDEEKGGEYGWAFYFVKFLAEQPVKLQIITGGFQSRSLASLANCRIYPLLKKGVVLSPCRRLIFSLQCFLQARRIEGREPIDVVHHVLPFGLGQTFNLLAILRRFRKKPFVIGPIQSPQTYIEADKRIYIRSDFSREVISLSKFKLGIDKILLFLSAPLFRWLSRLTLERADKVIVINQVTKHLLMSVVAADKIQVIPPGIDLVDGLWEYSPYEKKDFNQINILSVCYLVKRKGVDLVIRALATIVFTRKITNIKLLIAGDGPEQNYLRELVQQLSLDQFVSFLGFIPNKQMGDYYRRAHIFVSMSRSESWGQMYLEAMASGVPIITSVNNGSSSIIEDGASGYLIKQEDYLDLAEKIVRLVKERDLGRRFSARGRQIVEEQYDWRKCIIPQYIKIYEELTDLKV